jgi:hypothetical protein
MTDKERVEAALRFADRGKLCACWSRTWPARGRIC